MIKSIKKFIISNHNYKFLNINCNSYLFLLFCIILGTIFRFTLLTSKPIWTDEFATLVFSLGNTYNVIPLNQLITIDQLLQTLQFNFDSNFKTVASLLINEDNHPPLYFIIAHFWYKLFPNYDSQYLSLWVARSLPVLFGILSIPAMFFLAKISINSRKITYLTTWLITVSPYGIFLAQEARHYSLAILFVIFSLTFLVLIIKLFSQYKNIPLWLIFFTIVINILGFVTHYFFLITLASEVIALIIFILITKTYKKHKNSLKNKILINNYLKLFLLFISILIFILSWFIFILPHNYGSNMTSWIEGDRSSFLSLISPIFQLFASWITMISLLPVESDYLPIILISGAIMIVFFLWLLPQFYKGLKQSLLTSKANLVIFFLTFFITSILIFFGTTYFLNMDITRGARYNFVYFPSVLLLIAIGLVHNSFIFNKKSLSILIVMGLFSAITVVTNLGYQKYYRPDLLTTIINNNSTENIVIATTQKTLVETGEIMSIGWQLKAQNNSAKVNFLLAHQNSKNDPKSSLILKEEVNRIQQPFDLWLINFNAPIKLDKCENSDIDAYVDGYNYRLFHCQS